LEDPNHENHNDKKMYFCGMDDNRDCIRAIGVFCGTSIGAGEGYSVAARAMAKLLVGEGITMVYGGGNVGLMGVMADTMLEAGGKVIGVIPEYLVDKELGHPGVQDMRVVDTMNARKELMDNLSDAFIALPGGFGTMDEIFEMLTHFQLGVSHKPCALLNVLGFYDLLVKQLDHFVAERFLRASHRNQLLVHHDPRELLLALQQAAGTTRDNRFWIEDLKTNNRY
jgi:uncharacterized protein (TIGR00730 family)